MPKEDENKEKNEEQEELDYFLYKEEDDGFFRFPNLPEEQEQFRDGE